MPGDDRLHRRSIRAALMANRGWSVESRVDGWIDVQVPGAATSVDAFAPEVRAAVEALGYAATVVIGAGRRVIRVRTPETLRQAGRGAHGAAIALPASPAFVARSPHPTDAPADSGESGLPLSRELPVPETSPAPWIAVLRPLSPPFLERLSSHSDLVTWHADVEFLAFRETHAQQARWANDDRDAAETWHKRPLLVGADSGCEYSCGEVEIAARFRAAGYEAYWVSEWSGFPHVQAWRPFCVKRSELRERLPAVWEYDQSLRARCPELGLGASGGHPDVVAWRPESREFVYAEYKGPGDSMKPKQNAWAQALMRRERARPCFIAVKGRVSSY